jgi:hypothetical protein
MERLRQCVSDVTTTQSEDFRLAFRRFARKITRLYAIARNNRNGLFFQTVAVV